MRELNPLCPSDSNKGDEVNSEGGNNRKSRSEKKRIQLLHYKMKKKQNRTQERQHKRKRVSDIRREMLEQMNTEERTLFIRTEREEAEKKQNEIAAHLLESYNTGIPVYINCHFEDMMSEQEQRSLAKQLSMAYNFLKTCTARLKIHLLFPSEEAKTIECCKLYGYEKWMVYSYFNTHYWDVLNVDDTIVLTPDSCEVLTRVDPHVSYVIGGLVDKSVAKHETLGQAEAHNFKTARFPIPEHLEQHNNCVLSIDNVIQILIRYTETQDWSVTLKECIPARKQQILGRRAKRLLKRSENKTNDDEESFTSTRG